MKNFSIHVETLSIWDENSGIYEETLKTCEEKNQCI